jgi:hypothetical protein
VNPIADPAAVHSHEVHGDVFSANADYADYAGYADYADYADYAQTVHANEERCTVVALFGPVCNTNGPVHEALLRRSFSRPWEPAAPWTHLYALGSNTHAASWTGGLQMPQLM